MRLSPAMLRVLREMKKKGELPVEKIPTSTWYALDARGVIESCPRLYFGPRSERYRLSAKGKELKL